MARTPTSAPGNRPIAAASGRPRPPRARRPHSRGRGFTLLELLIVVALIAVASSVAVLALRDPGGAQLEREATRLAALLESARAESRLSGVEIRWRPGNDTAAPDRFEFLPPRRNEPWPNAWLDSDVRAEVADPRGLVLGPEPVIGAQRVVLRLGRESLVLATDGIAAFAVAPSDAPAR